MQGIFSILRQSGLPSVETTIVAQYSMLSDTPIRSVAIGALDAHAPALLQGKAVPVGSVEFVRAAMGFAGIDEPENLTYPEALRGHLHRKVKQIRAGSVLGHWFVKPITTKVFTGFVFDTMKNPEILDCHDRAQHDEFMSLSPDTPVWVSEPVEWLSETRFYIIGDEVLGCGRYDDGPDDAPDPDIAVVKAMAKKLAAVAGGPAAFTLDVGVLATGETALVECNDAWAIGYYRGTLSHKDYVLMLWRRWAQLASGRLN